MTHQIALNYTNWRGQRSLRHIIPKNLFFGSNEWHPEPQWLIAAWDCDKKADRTFTLAGFSIPGPTNVIAIHGRNRRQSTAYNWCAECFGAASAGSPHERARRVLEEALELAQAAGVTPEDAAHQLANVYRRPAGDPAQEIGGLSLTLLTYAEAAGLSADACEVDELNRVLNKPTSYFAQRHAEKAAAGVATPPPSRSDGEA